MDIQYGFTQADAMVNMDELLKITVERNASDLHLVVGFKPAIRVNGEIVPLEYSILKPDDVKNLLYSIINEEQRNRLEKDWELDFSYAIHGVARFRGNVMKQRGTLAAVFRAVPFVLPSFDDLGLPMEIKKLSDLSRGLVLVTGPTGSGKSTTLAALIDLINKTRSMNIVTIEDPIEFLHRHEKSTIRQREIGMDTHSFATALRHVLRHDPDVILIGEMRDLESISIALTAAETGHLVLSTLHTQTAPLTISRIVDIFSNDRRQQVRQQLAGSLKAVISQQLLPAMDGKGRVVAVEYMVDSPAVRSLIRDGKDHQIYNAIQTGHNLGMQTMDSALVKLCQSRKISKETALEYCIDSAEVERMLKNWI
ncbi:MAG: type IV pilus twitching motility protein PilT [Ruminiclostridium sp.]|nr:type IV pilus twitching motility protein PilT [Ruminiclostridium sp.]